MAVRSPLIWDAGLSSPRRMTTDEVALIVDECCYQYSLNPSVTLAVTAGVADGTLTAAITDTRQTAGASSTGTADFPDEATTAEPGQVTVTYQRINQTAATVTPTSDTGRLWPAYLTATGNVQSMTLTDVKDTFLHPAIDQLVLASTGTDQGGTYTVSTSSSLAGATLVDANPIYADTRADTTLYSAAEIEETLDQPTTITEYFLHRITGAASGFSAPLFLTSDGNLQVYADATFQTYLSEWIRFTAASSPDNHTIRYNIDGSGNQRGSTMTDTRLDGTGNYQTLQVDLDDYRAQEFPNGTAQDITTHAVKINKV
jgi:hypothetical protein